MLNTAYPHFEEKDQQKQRQSTIFQRSQREVRQDSIAKPAMQQAATQPASMGKLSRPRGMRTKAKQGKKHFVGKTTTEPTTIHLQPILKQRLRDLAAGQKDPKLASISGIAVALIQRGLLMEPDKPYGPSLEPVVQGAIHKGFSRHDNRLAPLQARDTRDSAETRHLMANAVSLLLQLLGKHEAVAPDAFERIIAETEKKGREALTKPDPWWLELVVRAAYAPQETGEEGVR
jgi:hypothetical protein